MRGSNPQSPETECPSCSRREEVIVESGKLLQHHETICALRHPGRNIEKPTRERFEAVLAQISYRHWEFVLNTVKGVLLFQVLAKVMDSTTGEPLVNYGFPYPLCPNMDDEFLVDLVFRCVKELEAHEAAEVFRYRDERVYFPHEASGKPLLEMLSLSARKKSH
jgi:hypothetical protein